MTNRHLYISIDSSEGDAEILQIQRVKRKQYQRIMVAIGLLLLLAIVLSAFVVQRHAQEQIPMLGTDDMRLPSFEHTNHPQDPSLLWGNIKWPYPTGSFWTNLVVGDGDGAIAVLPYGIKAVMTGIQISYGASRRLVSNFAVIDPFVVDIELSFHESYISRFVHHYDNISVAIQFDLGSNSSMVSPLVKGSPFVTSVYTNSIPVLNSPYMRFTSLIAKDFKGSSGVQYEIILGNYQKWLLYSSEVVEFRMNDEYTITASQAITGYLRLAILPIQSDEISFAILMQHVELYPVGGEVLLEESKHSAGDHHAIVTYQFKTEGASTSRPGSDVEVQRQKQQQLLMLALPHHMAVMMSGSGAQLDDDVKGYAPVFCMKGAMTPVLGHSWKLKYDMPNVGWHFSFHDAISSSRLDHIAQELLSDVKSILPSAQDPYNFGKQVARMGRLALMADYLGMSDARDIAVSHMEESLEPWLSGTNENSLLYDETWGGLVTKFGLSDASADFGSGWYSDHHFHYGYFVFAAAVLARYDKGFYLQHQQAVEVLVSDICSLAPSTSSSGSSNSASSRDNEKESFPFMRHKDLFDGHSWASGLFQEANGKGQESSSEAVNAYYGCMLFGEATGDARLTSAARIMLQMEIVSAQHYWHMSVNSTLASSAVDEERAVYDKLFRGNLMAGNVGGFDVTASTWFGHNVLYVHGINMMPLTPATELLFDSKFVSEEWPYLAEHLPPPASPWERVCVNNTMCVQAGLTEGLCCPTAQGLELACCSHATLAVNDEWKSFVHIARAVVDKEAAWRDLQALGDFGSGGSRSNALFFAATRSRPSLLPSSRPPPGRSGNVSELILPSCRANTACSAQGMTGNCCPADNGITLQCCPRIEST